MSRPTRVLAGLLTAAAFLPSIAHATQPLPDSDSLENPGHPGPRGGPMEWPTGRVNYLFELDQIVGFLADWQVDSGPNFGGMIEAEAGPLGNVVQTDNTLEAIWVWSHYTRLTGRTTYLQNIADAWVYCEAFPAWLEEGGASGYYRAHNCAWALTAESAYRAATGDTSFLDYAETSADWIVDHPLFLNQNQLINAFVTGWTAGNLYLYGEEMGNAGWMSAALAYGATTRDWIAVNPTRNCAIENWAMSSGTMVWGLCNSIFRDDPVAGAAWIAANGPLVDTFQSWYDVPNDSFDWDNSWNVAYINAHFGMYDVTGDPVWLENGMNLTNQLLSYDTDDDGGIQGTTQDPVTEDMSWVTCYLAKMGVDRGIGTPPDTDAGVLAFASPSDGETYLYPFGSPIPVQVQVTNFGLDDLTGVEVHVEGPVTESTVLDLPFAARETIELGSGWTAPGPGVYEFLAYVEYPGDENAENDSLLISVTVTNATAVGDELANGWRLVPAPNPFRDTTRIQLQLADAKSGQVEIFNASGQRVRGWNLSSANESLQWDGRSDAGNDVAPGTYYVRARSGGETSYGRVTRTR